MRQNGTGKRKNWLVVAAHQAVADLGWIISGALGLWVLFAARGAVLALYMAFRLPSVAFAVIDKWAFVLMGLVCLAAIVYIQHYYSQAEKKGLLLQRFGRVTAVELAVLGVAYLARFFAERWGG